MFNLKIHSVRLCYYHHVIEIEEIDKKLQPKNFKGINGKAPLGVEPAAYFDNRGDRYHQSYIFNKKIFTFS